MKINHIHIRNFRKLLNCRIDFDEKQTIFVGANNSGKTSAMSAIVWFLKDTNRFSTREFTLTNWSKINEITQKWLDIEDEKELQEILSPQKWEDLVPSLDIWLDVPESEAFMVYKIIPSLDWKKDMVGVRLRLEPKDTRLLYADYKKECLKVKHLKESEEFRKADKAELFPKDMWDFLNHRGNLSKYFEVKYYVLDSAKINTKFPDKNVQSTPTTPIEDNPIKDLIRVDSIEAFREFSDPEGKNDNDIDTLSKQLQNYYRTNFDDETDISVGDLKLLSDMQAASNTYDEKLKRSFKSPIEELRNINYPGFQGPNILVKSHINIIDSITHESSVQFSIKGKSELTLPEKYNGLGLRNLISIYLKLVQFREQWTQICNYEKENRTQIEPIHLVLIEEPEAHLHAQAQQVFIRKALLALTNNADNEILRKNKNLTTQLVVTTHSNHIVTEVDMNCLRYFKRFIDNKIKIPVSEVVNMSRTFGSEIDTKKFVTRYIKLTHCDIFFADAVILVEGAAEKILMPQFIHNEGIDNYYISIIEINGSHAHRFKKIIEKLDIPTLIVTDIDAKKEIKDDKGITEWKPCVPKKGMSQKTNNDSIKRWLQKDSIDELIDLTYDKKEFRNIRLAYQTNINIVWDKEKKPFEKSSIYPYTFEDSLVFTNLDLFRGEEKLRKMGVITTFYNYLHKCTSLDEFHQKIFECLESRKNIKAEFATSLLYTEKFESIKAPEYIKEGLEWLSKKLDN